MKKQKFKKFRPNFKEGKYIVCEGIADKIFLENLLKHLILKYDVKVEESGSLNKVLKKYRKIKSTFNEKEIFVFIDLDGKGSKNINYIKKEFRNNGYKVPKIYFVNPVIEYFFVLAKENKHSMHTKKEDYKHAIKRLYGIESYVAAQKECEDIVSSIYGKEWTELIDRISKCSNEKDDLPSTNLGDLINKLKSD